MTKTAFHIVLWVVLLCSFKSSAQQPYYTYFTIRDGLPSNDIYNCIEDKKGFLWIATENGLSKFDGKNFKNYSTEQGLPDNEILMVQVDNDGIVWALPVQRTPSYYDEKADRFINSSTDKELSKIRFASVAYGNPLSTGGMAFCNSLGEVFIYKNKKCTAYRATDAFGLIINNVIEIEPDRFLIVSGDSLRLLEKGKVIRREKLGMKRIIRSTLLNNNCLYIADSATLYKITLSADGSVQNKIANTLPFAINSLNFTGRQMAITSTHGNIYLTDTTTLGINREGFSFNSLVRFVFVDSKNNNWICTKESGLIRYQQKGILSLNTPAFQRNFNTITTTRNELVAGTNDGQLFFYKNPYDFHILKLTPDQNFLNWVRDVVSMKDGLVVSEEGGFYMVRKDLSIKTLFPELPNIASKACIAINDSIIVTGNSGGLRRVNIRSGKELNRINTRVISMEAAGPDNVYIGSNTGLYKWQNFQPGKPDYFGKKFPLLSTRINSLAYNKADGILWVGPATDSLVAMFNDSPIAVIPLGAALPGNNCRALFCSKKGIVWIGTNMALGRIEYSYTGNKFNYKISVFTTADGISGRQINDITERNDTIFLATAAGISFLPASLRFNVPDIPVYISSVKINNRDTSLLPEYQLNYDQNNISVTYAAADLAASVERIYEYRINKANWITVKTENIDLQQLSPGSYSLEVRILKRDGSPSGVTARVTFKIKTPFWRTWIFFFALFFAAVAVIFYFLQRRSRVLRERSVQQLLTEKKLTDLELKALKAQINPHFVFNCLNSIKYLNHEKKFTETEYYLDKFSYLLRKTLDFSGLHKITLHEELLYSRNYLELEKLRLGDKMEYEIKTAESIFTDQISVPPMLLQPYLENAVKHGIRSAENNTGKVLLETELYDKGIICRISDNGIGIFNSQKLNRENIHDSRPHGNTLQQRRADLYGISVNISEGENNKGTIVTLKIQTKE